MNIRKATMDDLEGITLLEARCFPPAEAAQEASFRSRLECFADYFWLLEEDGQIVSMVNGMVTDEEHLTDEMFEKAHMHKKDGKWQMIFGVATLPEYQGRGYAGMLLKRAIEDSAHDGRRGVVLTCKEKLLHYYAKFGFVDEGISSSEHGGAVWHEMRITFSEEGADKTC